MVFFNNSKYRLLMVVYLMLYTLAYTNSLLYMHYYISIIDYMLFN